MFSLFLYHCHPHRLRHHLTRERSIHLVSWNFYAHFLLLKKPSIKPLIIHHGEQDQYSSEAQCLCSRVPSTVSQESSDCFVTQNLDLWCPFRVNNSPVSNSVTESFWKHLVASVQHPKEWSRNSLIATHSRLPSIFSSFSSPDGRTPTGKTGFW